MYCTDPLDDTDYLTPGHFLIGSKLTAPAEYDLKTIPENRLNRWLYTWQDHSGSNGQRSISRLLLNSKMGQKY